MFEFQMTQLQCVFMVYAASAAGPRSVICGNCNGIDH